MSFFGESPLKVAKMNNENATVMSKGTFAGNLLVVISNGV
jgi:hypothetical protein